LLTRSFRKLKLEGVFVKEVVLILLHSFLCKLISFHFNETIPLGKGVAFLGHNSRRKNFAHSGEKFLELLLSGLKIQILDKDGFIVLRISFFLLILVFLFLHNFGFRHKSNRSKLNI